MVRLVQGVSFAVIHIEIGHKRKRGEGCPWLMLRKGAADCHNYVVSVAFHIP